MPKSKSKRSTYIPPKPARPKSSPRWLPALGLALIGLGVLLVLLNAVMRIPGGNWNLIVGFVFMAGGLLTLAQWR